jgi:osmotically-inducible protein OsmY
MHDSISAQISHSTLIVILALVAGTAAGQTIPDNTLKRSLEKAMERDIGLRQADIQVSLTDGAVGLRGRVKSYVAKLRAEQIANRERGVLAVHNWLQVDPELRSDAEIEHDVNRRLQLTYGLNPVTIHAQVNDGAVMLAGTVSAWPQLRQAELIVGEVRGVKQVDNKLQLDSAEHTSQANVAGEVLENDVKIALRRDAYIGYLAIDVSAKQGVVRLDGKVPNLFHRERAEKEARGVAGVRSVDNRLAVESQLTLELLRAPPSDKDLGQAVLDELVAYPQLATTGVRVEASAGNITLSGQAESLFEKRTAARIARNVMGVARVDNQLQVNTSERSDADILADVTFILDSDSVLTEQQFGLAINHGVVTLSGESPDLASKLRAVQLVSRVPGVQEIVNHITVKRDPATSDDALRESIINQLASNLTTSAAAPQIRVVVSQGQVTLVGKVAHTAELIEAGRIARLTDSVSSVANMLEVK